MRLLDVLHLSLAALCLSLASPLHAARDSAVDQAKATQTLYLGNGSEPQDLDPQTILGYNEFNIMIALFEGLTAIDEATARPVAATASRWEISSDGTVYTFHLRDNARWSNGDPVTAQDFVTSYERMLSPKLAAEYAYMLYPIRGARDFNTGKIKDFSDVGLKALDPHTLQIVLEHPTPYFLDLTAHQTYYPIHPATIRKFGDLDQRGTRWTQPGNLVGNGAFTLTEWLPNSRVVVKKNTTYWNSEYNRINQVVFYPNEDIPTDERNFRAGQIHATYDLLPSKIPSYRKSNPEALRIDPFLESYFLRFNVTKKPFDNVKVRQALARAIDREAICRVLLFGSRQPAQSLTPPNTAGYTPRAFTPTDFEAARALLAEAGYPKGKGLPTVEIQMNTDGINLKVFEAVQEMWRRELGVNARLVQADFRVYLDNMRTLHFSASRSRWVGDYNDPGTYLDMFVTDGGSNWTGWSNSTYDALIKEANQTIDQPRRYELLQQAEEILLREAPIAPIFYGAKTYLLDPSVKGWAPSLLGIHRYQTLHLE